LPVTLTTDAGTTIINVVHGGPDEQAEEKCVALADSRTNEKTPHAEYREKRKRKRKGVHIVDEDAPPEERSAGDVCQMKGEVRARYGLTIDHGSAVKAKWAYASEHLATDHALDAVYTCFRGDSEAFVLKGHFVDDPVLYGAGVKRTDEFEFTTLPNSHISGEGYCEFYGTSKALFS